MKHLFTTLFLLIGLLTSAQNVDITFDYTVDYTVPNKRQQSIDTITVGYEKSGRYLWSNFEGLAKEFAKDVFKKSNFDTKNSESNIIYDSETTMVYVSLKMNKSLVYFAISLEDIIPANNDPLNEDIFINSTITSEVFSLNNNEYPEYAVSPSSEPNQSVMVAINKDYKVDNNKIFKKFLELMLAKTQSNGNIAIDLPEGLILSIRDDNQSLLEAIKLDNTKKQIQINHSFKIIQ